eukprot:9042908-Pyramimonas_sp.AAC.1
MGEVLSSSPVCKLSARKSQVGSPSVWGRWIMITIRTGQSIPVAVATLGLLKRSYGGSVEHEPRL